MIARGTAARLIVISFLVMGALSSVAQPTLPDLTGTNENGLALLSWTCQYDGVKSISVLRSADSNFNYTTVGYVRKLLKGVQAFVDGHPMPGKNFYKLSIVFNSGLTWGSNHHGVYVDSASINPKRIVPANEALQKMIVTDMLEKVVPKQPQPKMPRKMAPAEREKYTEVLKKNMDEINDTSIKRPKFKFNRQDDKDEMEHVFSSVPVEIRKKLSIAYEDEDNDLNAAKALDEPRLSQVDPGKKKILITFDDKDDVGAFIETLPKSDERKITISYTEDTSDLTATDDLDDDENDEDRPKKIKMARIQAQQPKKVSVTFKDDLQAQAYMAKLPKLSTGKVTVSYNIDTTPKKVAAEVAAPKPPDPPKAKISLKFNDDFAASAPDIKSKYVSMDPGVGHVIINMPEDVRLKNYSIKFYDKENHVVVEVPKLYYKSAILDKHNFQKKGQYKFVIKRDGIEIESGYVTIF